MKTYKIGNKVTGIIRSFTSDNIGDVEMQWANQPYTVITGTEAKLNFVSKTKNAGTTYEVDLNYNFDELKDITLSNVPLNDKILNLIFTKNEEEPLKLFNENYTSDENGIIYFNSAKDEIYQLFIYDDQGDLEQAFGTFTEDKIQLAKPLSSYLFIYNKIAEKSYNLGRPANFYVTLDLKTAGNIEDTTAPFNIHIEKCGVRIDKNLTFNQSSNTVNLTFTVISDSLNYITFE